MLVGVKLARLKFIQIHDQGDFTMSFFFFLLTQLLFAYTILVEPILRTTFYRRLKKQLSTDTTARLLFYRTQILWELSWLVGLALIVIPIPEPLAWLGLTLPNQFGWIIMGVLILGVVLSTFLLRPTP